MTLPLDVYAPLNHKAPFAEGGTGHLAPTWVPATQQRRLTAYKVLTAYLKNTARIYLTTADNTEYREFGDPAVIVDRVVGAILGDDWDIVVDGADVDTAPPELPDRPVEPAADADPIVRRLYDATLAQWTETATSIIDQWEANLADLPALQQRQDWLRQWAEDEFLAGKMIEAEGDSVGLGDGIYQLEWDADTQRVACTVYDPGFYFPVLPAGARLDQFPDKIHLAWEFEEEDHNGTPRRYVRRLTWELVPITVAVLLDPVTGDPRFDNDGNLVIPEGTRFDDEGNVVRAYPWHGEDDDPSTMTCVFTDATWSTEHATKLADFAPDKAAYALTADGQIANRLDLHVDFVPIVHIPAAPATREHFGASLLLVILQILDELAALDTDRAAARALAGSPVIGISSAEELATDDDDAVEDTEIAPGMIIKTGVGGKLTFLDMTGPLEQLRLDDIDLLERLSSNASVPGEVIGRARATTNGEAGITVLLRFGPFRQLISTMRLVRRQKYALLLKMVQRMAQAGGELDPGPTPPASVVFGGFLPSDLASAVELVTKLLTAHAISRRVALAYLIDHGMPVDDARAELDRIAAEDTAGAKDIADATGSEELAAQALGLDLPAAAPAPTITLTPPNPTE